MSQTKISVIVPMFNTEKYIETCIDSILVQSLRDFELIIIDDQSTDRSYEIVRSRYCDRASRFFDPRIKLFKNLRNVGPGETRNRGIEMARGKYIQFVDSDDSILENMLETLYNRAEEKNLDVVFMNHVLVPKDSNFVMNSQFAIDRKYCGNHSPRQLSSNLLDRIYHEYINAGLFWMPYFKMIRRDLIVDNRIYFPNLFSGEDMLFQLALFFYLKRAEVIDVGLYLYRFRDESITHSTPEKYLRETVKMLPSMTKYFRDLWKNLPIDFPREHQITLEDHAFNTLISMHCSDRDLDASKIDSCLEELVREGFFIEPEVSKILFRDFIRLQRYMGNHKREESRGDVV